MSLVSTWHPIHPRWRGLESRPLWIRQACPGFGLAKADDPFAILRLVGYSVIGSRPATDAADDWIAVRAALDDAANGLAHEAIRTRQS